MKSARIVALCMLALALFHAHDARAGKDGGLVIAIPALPAICAADDDDYKECPLREHVLVPMTIVTNPARRETHTSAGGGLRYDLRLLSMPFTANESPGWFVSDGVYASASLMASTEQAPRTTEYLLDAGYDLLIGQRMRHGEVFQLGARVRYVGMTMDYGVFHTVTFPVMGRYEHPIDRHWRIVTTAWTLPVKWDAGIESSLCVTHSPRMCPLSLRAETMSGTITVDHGGSNDAGRLWQLSYALIFGLP